MVKFGFQGYVEEGSDVYAATTKKGVKEKEVV